jgi:HTH-type transcriptional regulator/antitoxin HipB
VDYIVQIPAQLAPLLKALRRSRGFTQKKLAEQLGITQQAVHQLEKRPERATIERLIRACTILGVDIVLRVSSDWQQEAPPRAPRTDTHAPTAIPRD